MRNKHGSEEAFAELQGTLGLFGHSWKLAGQLQSPRGGSSRKPAHFPALITRDRDDYSSLFISVFIYYLFTV